MFEFTSANTRAFILGSVVIAMTALIGCGDEEEAAGVCKGAKIFPHIAPFNLGEMYPTPENEDDLDYGSPDATPFEGTLLLQAPCQESVTVTDVCLVGDNADQFILEGPAPSDTISRNREVGIRLTYTRRAPADIDNVALVVQSNAENFPTLIVPVCSRVIAGDQEKVNLECESPISVPEGMRDDTLCAQ